MVRHYFRGRVRRCGYIVVGLGWCEGNLDSELKLEVHLQLQCQLQWQLQLALELHLFLMGSWRVISFGLELINGLRVSK